jgi:hypothetical protein
MPRVRVPKGELENVARQLDNWVRSLRIGTLQATIGQVKGAILPFAQGFHYDREDLYDQLAVWVDEKGAPVVAPVEGEEAPVRVRKATPIEVNGQKVGEQIVFRDPSAARTRLRALADEEVIVDIPALLDDKMVTQSTTQAASKDWSVLPIVDFGALRCLWQGTANIAND